MSENWEKTCCERFAHSNGSRASLNHVKSTQWTIFYWHHMGYIQKWTKNWFSHQKIKKQLRLRQKITLKMTKNHVNHIFVIVHSNLVCQSAAKVYNEGF